MALIEAAGGHATPAALDLTDPASIERLPVDRLDVLVNGGARYLAGEVAPADIADTIAGAVTGTILLTERLLPVLRASERPDIVNLISAAGEIRPASIGLLTPPSTPPSTRRPGTPRSCPSGCDPTGSG